VPTPAQGYHNAAGEKIPGTTTVIGGLGWNKNQLVAWANRIGLEGKSHRNELDKAADIGTQAHGLVEQKIKTGSAKTVDVDPKAVAAYHEYLEWSARSNIQILESEVALVSEQYQYGSTLDAMGFYDNAYELLDWKSSNGCYADHVIQLAAYGHNWMENHPDKPLRRVHLCRFGKEGGFHHHSWRWEDLAPAWEAFLCLRKLYDLRKPLEKMV
jgi:hypothetical protein